MLSRYRNAVTGRKPSIVDKERLLVALIHPGDGPGHRFTPCLFDRNLRRYAPAGPAAEGVAYEANGRVIDTAMVVDLHPTPTPGEFFFVAPLYAH